MIDTFDLNKETPKLERLFFDPKGLPDGMTNERYNKLMWEKDEGIADVFLNETEIKSGWHFCGSWDYFDSS